MSDTPKIIYTQEELQRLHKLVPGTKIQFKVFADTVKDDNVKRFSGQIVTLKDPKSLNKTIWTIEGDENELRWLIKPDVIIVTSLDFATKEIKEELGL
jgi:hypothetical protein